MITIIRKGIADIPNEAFTCPVCSMYVSGYRLEKKIERRPWMKQCCVSVVEPPLLPTFTCTHCASIWQYEPDPPVIDNEEKTE